MTTRVHGGVKTTQVLTDNLQFLKIACADFLAADQGVVETDGSAKPIEKAVQLVALRGTVVILYVEDGLACVALEHNSGWTAATLQAALVAAGFTTPVVTEVAGMKLA